MNNMIKYFAYGSNMNVRRMLARGVNFESRLPVVARDCKLTFNKMADFNSEIGYATLEKAPGEKTEGVLYSISKYGEKLLDRYEGYPSHYQKWEIVVYDSYGRKHNAITYIANPEKTTKGLKPDSEYLNHLLAGKDLLSEEYYKNLLKWRKI